MHDDGACIRQTLSRAACVNIRKRAGRLPAGLPRRENFSTLYSPSDINTLHKDEMQCSVTLNGEHNRGKIKMKTFNNYKNPYKKELNIDKIVVQLCTRLKDQESATQVGMPTCSIEQVEAVRRYYTAFPALKKGKESPLQYYLPPPLWCRKTKEEEPEVKMQCELSPAKDWNQRNKKLSTGKERRNSYQGQKRNKKRCNSYSRSFESKDNLPEWVTYEGVWDMENQDPVKEFIRAIALDEGYGTCENTVTDDIRDTAKPPVDDTTVPDWDDGLDLDTEWVITDDLEPRALTPTEEELYAKFEAKFDRSIEALWAKDQNTPDDEYQDLPIDFHDLLSSPSDHLLAKAPAEKCVLDSLECASVDLHPPAPPLRDDSAVSALPDRFRPLNLADPEPPVPVELESFALYEGEDIYEALDAVASTMRSFTAINHSRDTSGFVEVPPRRSRAPPPPPPSDTHPPPPPTPPATDEREDLLTSARTHFRPIRRETDAEPARYVDGDTFDIHGDLDPVEERRSACGGVYVGASGQLYLEYRAARTIHYSRLNLTPAQRCPDLEDSGLRLRFPVRQCDAGVQTERPPAAAWPCEECGRAAKKMRAGADPVWGAASTCAACAAPPPPTAAPVPPLAPPAPPDLASEWEELLSDISAAHARLADGEPPDETRADRKRRHSAALRCAPACTHPHARFLPCCALALDRPLTR